MRRFTVPLSLTLHHGAMRPVPSIAVLPLVLLLASCGDPFADEPPMAETDVRYAEMVCNEAGSEAKACVDAIRQIELRCYGTIGVVDCHTAADARALFETERLPVMPVDGRPPAPSPD